MGGGGSGHLAELHKSGFFFCFVFFWQIFLKMLSALFLMPAETKILVLLFASVERFGVSRMRDFYIIIEYDNKINLFIWIYNSKAVLLEILQALDY